MNKRVLSLSAGIAAGIIVLATASPAAAVAFTSGDVVAGGTTWTIDIDGDFVEEADRVDWEGNNDSFDDGVTPLVDGTAVECPSAGSLDVASDSTGDVIVSCPAQTVSAGDGELQAALQYRFFSDGRTLRAQVILTNDSGAPVSGATVAFEENYYQDSDTTVGASTTAGVTDALDVKVVDGDRRWVVYDIIDSETYEVPVIETSTGTAGSELAPTFPETTAGDGEDTQVSTYELPVVADGETVSIIHLYRWSFFSFTPDQVSTPAAEKIESAAEVAPAEGTPEGDAESVADAQVLEPAALPDFVTQSRLAVAAAWGSSDLLSLDGRFGAGLTVDDALNWDFTPADAELAETGADVSALLALAALLAVAGAGVLVTRRVMVARA